MEYKKYLLAIQKVKNEPEPIDWSLFPNYENQDINDIKNIDDFTAGISESYLRHILVELNMNNLEELTEGFVICHWEKGARRTLTSGVMFKEHSTFRTPAAIIEFLTQNRYDKEILNRIYNIFRYFNKTTEQSPAFKDFLHELNNLDPENLTVLNNLHYVDYIELRSLGMFISKVLVEKELENIDELPKTTKNINKTIKKELIKENKEVA